MASTHLPIQGSERKPLPGAVALGRANANATIEVSVKVRRKNPLPELTGLPKTVITRAQLRDTYGASQADIDAVVRTLATFGLRMVKSSAATRTVRLRGTVAAMESAFRVRMFNYSHPNGNYRGRVGAVHIPIALKDIVQGVFGLDNRRVARRRRQPPRDNPQPGSLQGYISSQLGSHYNFPPATAAGRP
jgi:kumamolisin